jgi:hypothetical protein
MVSAFVNFIDVPIADMFLLNLEAYVNSNILGSSCIELSAYP